MVIVKLINGVHIMKEAKALKGMQVAEPDYKIDQQYVELCREDFHWSIK